MQKMFLVGWYAIIWILWLDGTDPDDEEVNTRQMIYAAIMIITSPFIAHWAGLC